MHQKPLKPVDHGIIDYGFAAIQLGAPVLLGLNKKTTKLHQLFGLKLLGMNALTDTPAGIKPVISFKTHQKADLAVLGSLTALTAMKHIRNKRRSLIFHLALIGLSAANYLLTDYKSRG
ncbi:hypothetical protein LZ575_07340 [Antarcticibacterium sp. 1MA-6-2]|uniref:hypothetical protein n=1 Tax=Antarcticibacterium sp. 1MA-6-2 TaxID=2908210 RepID=UPI001F24CD82|nr:hypothetical protein [Antarcticibacterium sp. 1MA-6-2]UJH92334.1 hypothetical protein LZ575_07340 [Antarcticibacterium sp. 1MA-6-2]